MDYARLRHVVEVVAETTARVAEVIDEVAGKAYDFIEYAEDYWDEAQPPVETGPVVEDEVSLQDKVDYIYSKVGETIGFPTQSSEDEFKDALLNNPDLTDRVYQQYQTEEAGSGWNTSSSWYTHIGSTSPK